LSALVLDKRKRPVMPCCEKRAHLLLERGRAVVHRRYPFTIRLKDCVGGDVEPVRVRLDPGSRTTGIAVVADEDGNKPAKVPCLFELAHRGRQISEALTARRAFHRRGANPRYRPPRFDNRRKPDGWLAPGLQHRVDTKMTAHGFPRGYCIRTKSVRGFQTDDKVRAEARRPRPTLDVSRFVAAALSEWAMPTESTPRQTSPSRGRLLLRPAARASSPS
jgi:hypothetical protein